MGDQLGRRNHYGYLPDQGRSDCASVTSRGRQLMEAAAVDPFIFRLAIFVLAIFVGYYVVWSVTPALHTPLMSVTNAISSVIIVGALIAVGLDVTQAGEGGWLSKSFGFVAVVLASVNIFGGFLVTQRMLSMYKKKQR
ncbi:NAD(P) transhydrogenase subunit alpha [Parvibaculum sp.]|uniref:NAD(P) transhydrogenase subunit alpha n=1 Tax=Parvibaculum sp. TaxID=2024848 RepID=UPI00351E1DC3